MSKWISVKEKIPPFNVDILLIIEKEKKQYVLSGYLLKVFDEEKSHMDFCVYVPCMKIKDSEIHVDIKFYVWHISKHDKFNKITHWMEIEGFPNE